MKVKVDEQEFEIKSWSVRERAGFLKRLGEAPKAAIPSQPTVEESEAQLDFAVKFVAEQLGKDEDFVQDLNAVVFDKLFAEIIKANRAPLGQLGLSP
jgi:hypothetical protein